ncbi:MAG: histidine phosphatase family protein [Promethearchaeota archaeon]
MKELILVRHGQSEHHIKGLTGGWTDTPLTPLGCQQAAATAQRLVSLIQSKPLRFYCSDLIRAKKTAEIIGDTLGVTPVATEALRELNWGIVKDMTLEEARSLELPRTTPLIDWVTFPGAETRRQLYHRTTQFLVQLNPNFHGCTLIVSHGNAITSIIQWWLELAEHQQSRIAFDKAPCSITHLHLNEWDQKTIAKLNDTGHLDAISDEA